MPRWVWALSFAGLDVGSEFPQPGFQPGPLFFELDFFSGKFFQTHDVALLLQVQGRDFVAQPAQVLRGRKRIGLGLAEGFLALTQFLFDAPQRLLLGLKGLAMLRERGGRGGEVLIHRGQLLLGDVAPFLGLIDVGQGFGVLRGELAQPFFVEMNAAFVAVAFAFQLQAALLLLADLMFQFGKTFAQLA